MIEVLAIVLGLMGVAFFVGAYVLTTRPEFVNPPEPFDVPIECLSEPDAFESPIPIRFGPGIAIPVRSNPLVIDALNEVGRLVDETVFPSFPPAFAEVKPGYRVPYAGGTRSIPFRWPS